MRTKKKLGIIGGMGSRAGAVFLQKIIDYSPAETDQEFIEILFHNNSSVPDRTRAIVYNEPSPVSELLKSVQLFNENQVEVIALACITSYYFYDQLRGHTPARILNPLQLIAEHISLEYPSAARIGLLATTGTINTGLFHKALNSAKVKVVTLPSVSQEACFMQSVYMKNGFKSAIISDEARRLFAQCVDELVDCGVDLIIGGCTEMSIAVDPSMFDMPYVDTLDLLARKTVEHCYSHDHSKIRTHGQESYPFGI